MEAPDEVRLLCAHLAARFYPSSNVNPMRVESPRAYRHEAFPCTVQPLSAAVTRKLGNAIEGPRQ